VSYVFLRHRFLFSAPDAPPSLSSGRRYFWDGMGGIKLPFWGFLVCGSLYGAFSYRRPTSFFGQAFLHDSDTVQVALRGWRRRPQDGFPLLSLRFVSPAVRPASPSPSPDAVHS